MPKRQGNSGMTRGRIIFAVFLLFIVFIIADVYVETNIPVLSKINLQTSKLPEGTSLKILQITDVHDKGFVKNDSRLLELVKKSDADMLVITGDLADRSAMDFTNILSLSSDLKAQIPDVFYVPGNHEQSKPMMKDLYEGLSSLGIKVLMDSGTVYKKGDVKVNICGINFPFRETNFESGPAAEKKALRKALYGIDTESYTVLLSHSPRIVYSVSGKPFDLILSGHTHGGQVRFPFIGSIFRFDSDFFGEYDKGLFKLDSGAVLYVDSGLGTSILPVRFCDRADITLITINGK